MAVSPPDTGHRGLQGPPPGLPARARLGWAELQVQALVRNPFRQYEWMLREHIPRDGVVFDIGANVGHFTKVLSRIATEGMVYALEPSPYANSILNNWLVVSRRRNVRILPVAISDQDGRALLRTGTKRSGRIAHGGATLNAKPGADLHHEVETVTLDKLVERLAPGKVSFVKIDVEGFESRAIDGARRTLREMRPVLLVELKDKLLEMNGASLAGFWEKMTDLGYEAFDIESGAYRKLSAPENGRHITWIAKAG